MMKNKLSPSIMCVDFLELQKYIGLLFMDANSFIISLSRCLMQ